MAQRGAVRGSVASGSGVSPGALLHVSTKGHDSMEVLDAKGHASPVPSL